MCIRDSLLPPTPVTGRSSTPRPLGSSTTVSGILDHPPSLSRVMTPPVRHLESRTIHIVVPAKAGTHHHQCELPCDPGAAAHSTTQPCDYGSWLSPGRQR